MDLPQEVIGPVGPKYFSRGPILVFLSKPIAIPYFPCGGGGRCLLGPALLIVSAADKGTG